MILSLILVERCNIQRWLAMGGPAASSNLLAGRVDPDAHGEIRALGAGAVHEAGNCRGRGGEGGRVSLCDTVHRRKMCVHCAR